MSSVERGPVRLTPAEVEVQRKADAEAMYTASVNGKPASSDPNLVEVSRPRPAEPAPVTLPVRTTAKVIAIRAEGDATAASIRFKYEVERQPVEEERSAALARLALLREQQSHAVEAVDEVTRQRSEFLERLPRRLRRRLGQRPSRVSRLTPWAMWAADTLMMANPYSIFGAVSLPFAAGTGVSNGVMLARAGLVGFGFTFGAKGAGAALRNLVEEQRERKPTVGVAAEAGVVAAMVGGLVWLATAAATLQAAFLALIGGSTEVRVPGSVLIAIVGFFGLVSFSTGFFSNDAEIEQGAALDTALAGAKEARNEAARELADQVGVVRGLRKQLTHIDAKQRLEEQEQGHHTEARVAWHMDGNRLLYGLEIDPPVDTRAISSRDDPDSPDEPDAPAAPVVPLPPRGPLTPLVAVAPSPGAV